VSGGRFTDPRVDRDLASREATVIQRRGADPRRHVVLRASAGSGKTKVLIDRLVRLLLDGAPLKSLAAMTFTRKAAVEIRDRLLDRVRAMARDDDEKLRARLVKLLDADPTPAVMQRARNLFEEVLDDPSGVHIGTIHTFCQSLLTRFADVAGVDPAFGILERTDELRDEALDRLERECAADPVKREAYVELAPNPSAARTTIGDWLKRRLELDRWCDGVAARPDAPEGRDRTRLLPLLTGDLARKIFAGTMLAGDRTPSPEDLRGPALDAVELYLNEGIPAVRRAQEPNDTPKFHEYLDKRAAELRIVADELAAGGDPLDALSAVRAAVFTRVTDDPDVSWKPKTGTAGGNKNKEERLEAYATASGLVVGVVVLGDLMGLLQTNALQLRFGLRFLDLYDGLKRRDRVLDFHDLERLTWNLVRHQELGPWVLYRMDERLDHLLVDEFQDTNRNQWDIVEPFVEEFLSALDERQRPRTVFLVGDVKQSIYRFRGACPDLFAEAAAHIADVIGPDTLLTLPTNFRSLPEVVLTVGQRFGTQPLRRYLPNDDEADAAAQMPYRDMGPGKVVFRPVEPRVDDADPHDACARRAAEQIREIVGTAKVWDDDLDAERPARYDDVLVLCRARTHMGSVEQALRLLGIPYEPAGRGALGRAREVRDVAELIRWLIFPADDTALAAVLRSPLVRLSEERVQSLLVGVKRRGDLLRLLDESTDAETAATAALLQKWLERSGRLRVHDLLRLVFRDAGALERYAEATGAQSRQNLLRLHDLALSHDQSAFASLRGFLKELDRATETNHHEEGALPESEHGRVRVMTIHKSKGLEAPFVLLVDSAAPFREDPNLVQLGDDHGPMVGGLRKEHRRPPGGDITTAVSAASVVSVSNARKEEANLLYVAMTRARDELHVLAVEPSKGKFKPSHARWLEESGQPVVPWPDGDDADNAAAPAGDTRTDRVALWTPCSVGARLEVVSPSAIEAPAIPVPGDQQSLFDDHGTDDDALSAADRGTLIHLWLQRAVERGAMPPGAGEEWDEAKAVFENPAHDAVFRPGDGVAVLCEAPILHRLPGNKVETRMQGVIDLLSIGPEAITIVDYKSNRASPDRVPGLVAHYRPQMDAYRDALAAAYPGRPITSMLLFTHLEKNGHGLAVTLP